MGHYWVLINHLRLPPWDSNSHHCPWVLVVVGGSVRHMAWSNPYPSPHGRVNSLLKRRNLEGDPNNDDVFVKTELCRCWLGNRIWVSESANDTDTAAHYKATIKNRPQKWMLQIRQTTCDHIYIGIIFTQFPKANILSQELGRFRWLVSTQ